MKIGMERQLKANQYGLSRAAIIATEIERQLWIR
ncbi:hypothetical protein J2X37_002892 [Croceicoccus sp. BE223]|nr:hypothetical protein [Croceicoccus sp. BE223]